MQAQSPGARDDARAEALRSNTARCTKRRARVMRRIAIRPCSAAPGNTATSGQRRSERSRATAKVITTTKIFLCRVEFLLRTQPDTKGKGGPKAPLFLRPRKTGAGQTPGTSMPHPSAAAAAGAERRTRPTSDGIPRAFPRPMKRCSALLLFPDAASGRVETRLSAGLAPLARAMFPRGVFRKSAGS